eukprot:1006759-Amphidinium_carterae.1
MDLQKTQCSVTMTGHLSSEYRYCETCLWLTTLICSKTTASPTLLSYCVNSDVVYGRLSH